MYFANEHPAVSLRGICLSQSEIEIKPPADGRRADMNMSAKLTRTPPQERQRRS